MSIEGDRNFGGAFSPGEVLTAAKMNELAAAAGYGKQWHSSGSQVAQGTFGTVDLNGQTVTPSQGYDYPFKVTVGNGNGNEKIVYVRPGTVNNFVPKISGAYLDFYPPPSLTFSSVSTTKKKIVALKVTKTSPAFFPASCEIVLRDDEESLVATDFDAYLQLASISCSTKDGKLQVTSISQFVYASQIVTRAKPGDAVAVWSFTSR